MKSTPPDQWSQELKDQIVAAGHDLEKIAERVRLHRARKDEVAEQLDAIARRIRAAVEGGDLTAEEGRERMAEARRRLAEGDDGDKRLQAFRKAVIEEAMATPAEEWSHELKAKIERAGWDLEEFTAGVTARQEHARQTGENVAVPEGVDGADTAVEERTWGQVKTQVADTE